MCFLRPGRLKGVLILVIVLFSCVQFNSVYCENQDLSGIIINSNIHYSEPIVSKNFTSTTKYRHSGLGHLYLITNEFINIVLNGSLYPEELVYLDEHKNLCIKDDISSQWKVLGKHYSLVICIVAGALIYALALPIIGFLFCCCRSTGRCGSRAQPFEKRYDPCKRHTIGFLLTGVTILIMFGVVCAFITNEYMEHGIRTFPKSVNSSVKDTKLFLNNTKKEVNTLLIDNFNELDETLSRILQESGRIVKDKLGEISKATVLANLTDLVSGLETIREDLKNIDSITYTLKEQASVLEHALKETKERLLKKLQMCRNQRPCMDFLRNYNITNLSLESNFTQLPDVTVSLHNISNLIENDIEKEVLKGRDEFLKVQMTIQSTVNQNIPLISKNVKKIGVAIRKTADEISDVLSEVDKLVTEYTREPLEIGDSYLNEYGDYRYYTGFVISGIVLSALCCLTFGLICGFCGKRPRGYDDDCCTKGTGAVFLMMGIWIIFLTSGGVMFITLINFFMGISTEFAVCRPLENPGNSHIFQIIDELFPLDNLYNNIRNPEKIKRTAPKLSHIIRMCHQNSSIYDVLDLDQMVNISEILSYPSAYDINKRIEEVTSEIRLQQHIDILTQNGKRQLKRLADSTLINIDLEVYTTGLTEKITSIDLLQLSTALVETANRLPNSQSEAKISLKVESDYVKLHQDNHVQDMIILSRWLSGNASQLIEHLKFNQSSLRSVINNMLDQISEAQVYLNARGPSIVNKLASEFGNELYSYIETYLQRVIHKTHYEVGNCYPISLVYNATLVSACNKIIDPFNGFWVSTGWILILFIPALVFAIKLTSLYRKTDPYPGPLFEAEYLYDPYTDHNNVPLVNMNGKKKKGNRRYQHELGGMPPNPAAADYSEHLGRAHAENNVASASASGIRYNDIMPKNWDYGEAGPPRYHQAQQMSTEYERPPPYYYPGPAPTDVT